MPRSPATKILCRIAAGVLSLVAASHGAEPLRVGVGSDGIFRITPQRPVPELRAEAHAAQPPTEAGPFRRVDLVELTKLDPTIKLDIRYATANNFLSTPVYTRPAAYLQRPAAEALVRVHRALSSQGYGLLVHDAYRPWWVTKVFWEATQPSLREFVADPAQGSRHNRGCAVDLTLYDLDTGQAVSMPSVYDEMSPRAYPDYAGGTPAERERRDLLRRAMEREGFSVYETEWWHFDFKDWRHYPIVNLDFERMPARP
jgi:zinc D-Ala-D-Ala dipeptidase